MNDSFENFKQKSKEACGLGNYRTTAADIPPVSAHLLRLVQIQPGDSVLDVACGYGNTAITARRKGAKVTGIDLTPRMLAQAKEEEILAEVNGIEWREGDVEGLPFEDGSFDIVLSSFGHMFAPSPDIASKEMIRVAKSGGKIGFATWSPELAVGAMYSSIAKYIASSSLSSPYESSDVPASPLQWGIPEVIQKRLIGVKDLFFGRGTMNVSVLSPNHYWKNMSTNSGPFIQVIGQLSSNKETMELLRRDFLKAIEPYTYDNILRLGCLLTVARKE